MSKAPIYPGDMAEASPLVAADGWGYLDVAGIGRVRDAKLWPGGGRTWDWRETGTDHHPGIQPTDVAELLEHGPELIVLSSGRQGRLGLCGETLALLQQRGVEAVREDTGTALETYNALASEGRRVAGLFHTTC
jgi:hypothetical protein